MKYKTKVVCVVVVSLSKRSKKMKINGLLTDCFSFSLLIRYSTAFRERRWILRGNYLQPNNSSDDIIQPVNVF